ncbi:hypothetical protein G3A43_07180 [Paraburkholderia aspalathi]|nr:hypothetical protein [Paraburkholderia aspalathi]MBK3780035.1 hypothetical protein [Paraburkholderia aspalathi]
MFDIVFGAAHAIYIAGALVGSVILWPDQTYPLHKAPEEREIVEVVGFHPQWYKADSKCHYSGLIVPYVRDWPETIRHGDQEEVLPPDLDHTAGHAVILDKKTCPGKDDEQVFLVDAVERNFGFLGGGTDFHFDDPDTIKPEYKPKWLPQVMQRLARVAEHDENAKELLTSVDALEKTRAEKAQAAAAASGASAPVVAAPQAASAPAAEASQPVAATAAVPASATAQSN